MTVTRKRLENYEKDKDNFITVKVPGGYNVTNVRTMKMYRIYKENGKVNCTCPDWINRGSKKNEACKHIVTICKNYDRKKAEEIQKYINRW